jgi:uncharacterized phage protein (predicted DNA packaging)
MMIVTVADLKSHLRIEHNDEDALLEAKIRTASAHIQSMIGVPLADFTEMPEPLKEAGRVMAGHLYENREATAEAAVQYLPLGFHDLVRPYRSWVMG